MTPLDELAAIYRSLRAVTSTLDLPEILRAVLDSIKAITTAEGLSLLLYDRDRDELVFAASETLLEDTLIGGTAGVAARWVLVSGESALLEDGHVLLAPLQRAGKTVGALELHTSYDGGPFDATDRAKLEVVAASLADAADADRLSHDAEALRRLFARVAVDVPSQAATLVLLDPQGHTLRFSASRALEPGVIDGVRLRCGEGIAGWVARHREAVRLDDASSDPRHYTGLVGRTGLTPHGMICVPVLKGDTLLGVLQVINKLDGSAFNEDEQRLVQALADHAAIAIDNARHYRDARIAALTDDLTGLGNTRHFNEMLPRLLIRGEPVSLLVLDLDNFKAIVDTHGHLLGSRTIAFVGRLIARFVRPGDLAARFGGDEFVLVLPATDTHNASRVGRQILDAIADAPVLPGTNVDLRAVTASIGVATFPDHATDADGLFRAADAAMYAVKGNGKNAVGVAPRVD